MKNAKKRFWEFKNAANSAEIGELYIYGAVTSYKWDDNDPDVTAASFNDDLKALGAIKTLNLYINSPGGSVFQGQAIHSILKRHPANKIAHIDGLAASISSVIPMACDTIYMPLNASMMIHKPWNGVVGNANDFRKAADDMDKIEETLIEAYMGKAGDKLDRERLVAMLNDETWLTAQECYDLGLCDVVGEAKEVAACIDEEWRAKYSKMPDFVAKMAPKQPEMSEEERKFRAQLVAEAEHSIATINFALGGLTNEIV
ncbi:Clp protease ClpP [Paenibacillus sp. D9]|uniref:head maturation protease, ClpP-related n=1 Tax=Paenibacillus sp. D9 TaxID=665792 RepID=UPI00061EA1E6|nr:head maturation protease, ClpP-related [Paenibacillus sp. D9]KKC49529.1 Clp protease ClpP [Paenibacillus sp. D9]